VSRSAPWESEHGTVDVAAYNRSLLEEPERDRLRFERTTEFLRHGVLVETFKANGSAVTSPSRFVPPGTLYEDSGL